MLVCLKTHFDQNEASFWPSHHSQRIEHVHSEKLSNPAVFRCIRVRFADNNRGWCPFCII
uniref:Uncharacterized protein n=1 Tax=Meloidogyne incognita TaxID=6306 RepID=A0A914KLQ7_MELIC